MSKSSSNNKAHVTVQSEDFEPLLHALTSRGYRIIGPRVRDGTIVYDDITSIADLPIGYVDAPGPGVYHLEKTDQPAYFGYTLSPQSWKRYLFPPEARLWQASRSDGDLQLSTNGHHQPEAPFAFIGVRPCELRAIAIQDRVFLGHDYPDPIYKARRENAFIVAVNCTRAGSTCFCASMNAGPRAGNGDRYDLALTEVVDEGRHYFVVEIGSERGADVMQDVPVHATTREEQARAAELLRGVTMQRSVSARGLKDVFDHPRWDEVANRCLACGNCTMVCPTCFCTTIEDVTDLTGSQAERVRKWDTCFSLDFSYIFGGNVRTSVKSRYRQWLMHKMINWNEQFGTMGCVGCGRCITWCPVGIDITEEVRALRESEPAGVK